MAFSQEQHPIVLQIGGSHLESLAESTQLANAYHYDEINFKFVPLFYLILLASFSFYNFAKLMHSFFSLFKSCGCPSSRVAGHGCFGARLMLDPKV